MIFWFIYIFQLVFQYLTFCTIKSYHPWNSNINYFHSLLMIVCGVATWFVSWLNLSLDTDKLLQHLQQNSFDIQLYICFSNIIAIDAKNTNAAPVLSIIWGTTLVNRIWATKAITISNVRRVATVAGGTIWHDWSWNRKPSNPNKIRNRYELKLVA